MTEIHVPSDAEKPLNNGILSHPRSSECPLSRTTRAREYTRKFLTPPCRRIGRRDIDLDHRPRRETTTTLFLNSNQVGNRDTPNYGGGIVLT
ncbi:hypothetical protein E4T56_gene4689 [Termitomyces sp. T112]|nr:hypothetical protein E4T56_gene4689 [Termitomyces sp. T112]